MARSFARVPRRKKEPPAPVVYELSTEIHTVMERVARLNPVQFGWTTNFRLGCVIVRGSKPKEQGGCVMLARFVKVPPLWHGLTGYDAIIRVEEWAWKGLSAEQQEALVTHELCHGAMSDKGTLRVMKHDLEEFGFVVRKYGAWQENIALFDKQLALFEPGLGTAPTEGQQTVVPFEKRSRVDKATTPVEEATRMLGDVVEAIVEPHLDGLQRLADDTGTDITIEAGGKKGTIRGRRPIMVPPCPFPGCTLTAEHGGDHDFDQAQA